MGDVKARTATVGIDPEEEVTCTFTMSRGKGTIVLVTEPFDDDVSHSFNFPLPPDIGAGWNRSVRSGGSWTSERRPGSYIVSMTTDVERPWELKEIECDDGGSDTPSLGDMQARTATFGLDPGEHVPTVGPDHPQGRTMEGD